MTKLETATSATAETRAPIAATFLTRWLGTGYGQAPDWSAEDAVHYYYLANVYVFAAVRAIAQDIAALPFRAGADPDNPEEYNKDATLARLLGPEPGSPNQEMSATEFWQYTIAQYLLAGAFCWELEPAKGSRDIYALWPLMAQYAKPIPSKDPARYFDGVEYAVRGKTINFKNDRVLYHWRKGQKDIRQPESFLEPAMYAINVMVMQDRYDYAFLKNDARPAAVIVHEAFASVPERDTWRQNFVDTHAGPENAGRIHWVEASEDGAPPKDAFAIQTLGLSQSDAEFIARYDQKIRDLIVATGVPMSRLGDSSERTYANADKEYEIYRKNVLLPLARELTGVINRKLAPRLDGGRYVGWFDTRVFETIESQQKLLGAGLTELLKHRIVKMNEARAALGLPPVEGGDRFMTDEELALLQQGAAALLSSGAIKPTVKDPDSLELSEEEIEAPEAPPASDSADQPVAQAPSDQDEDDSEDEATPSTRQAAERRTPRVQLEQRQLAQYRKFDKRVRQIEAQFQSKFEALLERQMKITLDRLEGKRGRKLLTEFISTREARAAGTGIFDPDFWLNATADEFIELYTETFGAAAASVYETLGIAVSFDVRAPYVQDYVTKRANQLAGNVTQTTYDAIKDQLAKGAAEGEDIPTLAKRIRNLFQQTYEKRAVTVARTEVISAYNGSTLQQALELGADVVAATEWIATPGSRTRHTHRTANGQLQLINQPFNVGAASLMFPGDPSGPGKEVINCRCALGLLTPDEARERGLEVRATKKKRSTRANPTGYNQYKQMPGKSAGTATIKSKTATAEAEGSVVSQTDMGPDEINARIDDVADLMDDPAFNDDEGVQFARFAAQEDTVFVAEADGIGVTAVLGGHMMSDPGELMGNPKSFKVEYVGTTGMVDGAGSQAAGAAIKHAAANKAGLLLEPSSPGAEAFWTKVGMKWDPNDTGAPLMGMTPKQVQAAAKELG